MQNVFTQTISDVIENALGAVVTVAVYKTDFSKKPLGFRGESFASAEAYAKALDLSGAQSSGSGFVVTKNGKKYVITNAHVIESASSESGSLYIFTVSRKKYEVKVLGGDSFYDFAVLEFVDAPGTEISSLQFSDIEPRIGMKVYAIGNPLGEYPYSVTDGIISAKNRVRGGATGKFGFIQSTATVIWGNSGGPLINESGKVVGINSQIAFAETPDNDYIWQSQINFALESAISERLFNDIITNNGVVKRAFFGLMLSQKTGQTYDEYGNYIEVADELPLIDGALRNSLDYQVIESYKGAQVIAVNSASVRNLQEAMGEFEKVTPGASITLKLRMNGNEVSVPIKSRLFTSQDHEQIAIDFISNTEVFDIDRDHPQVVLVQRSTKGYYLRDGNKELKKMNQLKSTNDLDENKSIVLAAGIFSEDDNNLWKTETLRDFGSAIRINSLSGVIDLCQLPFTSQNLDDIQLTRYYLSGDENILKSVLFY
jgi:S1-C subfamily serine protease